MSDEKRMIDDYEVIQSVKFGGREYVIAQGTTEENSSQYMTCISRWDNPFGIMVHENGIVSDDYLEVFDTFIERLSAHSKVLSDERNEIPVKALTGNECIKDGLTKDLENQIVIIKSSCLSPEYRTVSHQIKLVTGGFGCKPDSRGSAVFCTDVFSGKSSRFERRDIEGIADISKLPEWTRVKIDEMGNNREKTSILKTLETTKNTLAGRHIPKKEPKDRNPEL